MSEGVKAWVFKDVDEVKNPAAVFDTRPEGEDQIDELLAACEWVLGQFCRLPRFYCSNPSSSAHLFRGEVGGGG
jgi:hypothetical protein